MTDGQSTGQKKKMKTWVKVLIGIVIVAVIGIVAALAATAGPTKAAEEFLTTLSSKNYHQAYESSAGMFRQTTSEDDFTKFITSYPILADVADHTFSYRKVEAGGTGMVSGSITGSDGTVSPITFRLVKENGEWRVLGVSLDQSDVPTDL